MIRGVVNARHEAVVQLSIRGPTGAQLDVDAVVDSGFTSSLTLPRSTVTALGLPRKSGARAILADGSLMKVEIYAAEVLWSGKWRPVFVSAMGDEDLLGMGLLAGHLLQIAVVHGGVVEISPLP